MTIKICIDAGHYGNYNASPAVKGYFESTMAWTLQGYLKTELEKRGMSVITTRTNKELDKPLFERGRASKGCDLFISLHSNAAAGGIRDDVDYPVAFVQTNGSSTELGTQLAKVIEDTMNTKQAGKVIAKEGAYGDYFEVLRGSASVKTPGILLEHSFHTNTKATKFLLDSNNLKKLAIAQANCIQKYFNVSTPPTSSNGTNVSEYKVRVEIDYLKIRKGPGTNHEILGTTGIGAFTIVAEADGKGATKWGLLKSYASKRNGWISLDYATKVK